MQSTEASSSENRIVLSGSIKLVFHGRRERYLLVHRCKNEKQWCSISIWMSTFLWCRLGHIPKFLRPLHSTLLSITSQYKASSTKTGGFQFHVTIQPVVGLLDCMTALIHIFVWWISMDVVFSIHACVDPRVWDQVSFSIALHLRI